MVPLAGLVDVAVLRLDRVADPIGHVGAGPVREAERLGGCQRLDGRVGAALELRRREHPGEQVDRLDAGEDPRAGLLNLGQLVAEEHEERLDHHVGALQDRRRRDGDRRAASCPTVQTPTSPEVADDEYGRRRFITLAPSR